MTYEYKKLCGEWTEANRVYTIYIQIHTHSYIYTHYTSHTHHIHMHTIQIRLHLRSKPCLINFLRLLRSFDANKVTSLVQGQVLNMVWLSWKLILKQADFPFTDIRFVLALNCQFSDSCMAGTPFNIAPGGHWCISNISFVI